MKRAEEPTPYLLLSADHNSDWNDCNYAIVPIDSGFIKTAKQRLSLLAPFRDDEDFVNLTYWNVPVEYYYTDDENWLGELLPPGRTPAFVTMEAGEPEGLKPTGAFLSTHQMLITGNGTAQFKAYAYNGDEFWTMAFDLKELANLNNTP